MLIFNYRISLQVKSDEVRKFQENGYKIKHTYQALQCCFQHAS